MPIDICVCCGDSIDTDEVEAYRSDLAHECWCDECYEYELSTHCENEPKKCNCPFHKGLQDAYEDSQYQRRRDADT